METQMRGKARTQLRKLAKNAADLVNSIYWRNVEIDKEELKMNCECLVKKIIAANEFLRKANESVQQTLTAEEYGKECDGIMEYEDKAMTATSQLGAAVARLSRSGSRGRQASGEGILEARQTITTPASSAHSMAPEIKLRPMELKKFRGNFYEWLPFWEQFEVAVHDNEALSEASKFNYLSSCLEGKAAATISGFLPTGECYEEAIKILTDEYGKDENIIEKFIQKLVGIKAVNSANDMRGLLSLYNEVSSTMRTLTALKVPATKYELMVKSILLKSIPSNFRVNFQRNKVTKTDKDEIKTLLEFLKNEIEAIEKSSLSESDVKMREERKDHKFRGTATALLTNSTSSHNFCIFCKIYTQNTRTCLLKREGRCCRCTNKSHTSKFCKALWLKCDDCGGRHMTSMCERKIESTEEQREEKKSNTNQTNASTTALSVMQNIVEKTYLQTARAIILNSNKEKSILARIIMDNGSQRTFITQALKEKLKLKSVVCKVQKYCLLVKISRILLYMILSY